jgi:hypothetical protein
MDVLLPVMRVVVVSSLEANVRLRRRALVAGEETNPVMVEE